MTFVLDASVTLAWAFEDERSPLSARILARLADDDAAVPGIWPLEIANGLLTAERRGRLTRGDTAHFLALLDALFIELDDRGGPRVFSDTMPLARDYGVSAYDAAYLELAVRTGSPLATVDDALRTAAAAAGVSLVG